MLKLDDLQIRLIAIMTAAAERRQLARQRHKRVRLRPLALSRRTRDFHKQKALATA